MKRKSASFLAGVLVASMVATPLSYTNVYAQEQDVVEADAAQTESESDVVSDNTDNVSENVSEKEITEKLQIAESTVKTQRQRAKQYLRKRLKNLYTLVIFLFFE